MECWKTEDPRLAERDLHLIGDPHPKLKSGHHPLFIPNIPFFHHSIIPFVI